MSDQHHAAPTSKQDPLEMIQHIALPVGVLQIIKWVFGSFIDWMNETLKSDELPQELRDDALQRLPLIEGVLGLVETVIAGSENQYWDSKFNGTLDRLLFSDEVRQLIECDNPDCEVHNPKEGSNDDAS